MSKINFQDQSFAQKSIIKFMSYLEMRLFENYMGDQLYRFNKLTSKFN